LFAEASFFHSLLRRPELLNLWDAWAILDGATLTSSFSRAPFLYFCLDFIFYAGITFGSLFGLLIGSSLPESLLFAMQCMTVRLSLLFVYVPTSFSGLF
jgi:hypothetical protein